MAKGRYQELKHRYLTNQVTEEERLRIDAWLDMLVDTKTRNLELSDDEKEELYRKFMAKQSNIESITSYRPESLKRLQRKTWTMRLAAGIIISLVVGLGAYKLINKKNNIEQRTLYATSEVQRMKLADGTLVWKKEGTEITYELRDNVRHVSMKGEALFEVAKNPALPFIIEYDQVNVKVFGTSFSLKTGEQVELKVLTGKVSVTTDTDSVGVIVIKDEQVMFTAQNGLQKESLPAAEVKRIVSNSDYDMQFTDVKLGTVLTRLEKKFDVSFEVADPHAKECEVRLNVTDNSLEDSLQKMTAILNVEYKIDGSVIKLTGRGCN